MTTTTPVGSTGGQHKLRLAIGTVVLLVIAAAVLVAIALEVPQQLGLVGATAPEPPAAAPAVDEIDDIDAVIAAEEEAAREAEEAARREAERLAEEAEARAEAERLAEEEAAAAREAEEAAEAAAEEEAARRAEEEAVDREAEKVEALRAAQQRLVDLGYLVGAVDGEQGQQTTAALMAFQAVNGIQVDGILGPQTEETLAEPLAEPQLRGGPDTRIEVDLDRQVLHLVEDGARVVTMKVSSGNGATYRTQSGGTARSLTPIGEFTIERRIAGVRESSSGLGTLYDPMYYHRGWAIHGSNSVPAGPASHGCIRVSRADAVWLFQRVPNGTPVSLYGGTHVFTPSR